MIGGFALELSAVLTAVVSTTLWFPTSEMLAGTGDVHALSGGAIVFVGFMLAGVLSAMVVARLLSGGQGFRHTATAWLQDTLRILLLGQALGMVICAFAFGLWRQLPGIVMLLAGVAVGVLAVLVDRWITRWRRSRLARVHAQPGDLLALQAQVLGTQRAGRHTYLALLRWEPPVGGPVETCVLTGGYTATWRPADILVQRDRPDRLVDMV